MFKMHVNHSRVVVDLGKILQCGSAAVKLTFFAPCLLDTQLLRESTVFVQVLSNLLTSLTSKKISLLYKITNSIQRLIFARNS